MRCVLLTIVTCLFLAPSALIGNIAYAEKNNTSTVKTPKLQASVEHLERSVDVHEPVFLTGRNTLEGILVKTAPYPIDLKTVLELADLQNLSIAQDRMGKKVASARFYQSLSEFLPDFYAQYGHSRFNGVVQIFGNETLKIYQTAIEPQFGVTYRVYPGGKTLFDALAARRTVNASQSLLKQTYQEQLATAVENYYSFLEAQMKLEFVKLSLDEAKEQLNVDESRYNIGVGTKLQVMQAKTQVAQRTLDVVLAEGTVAKAQQALLNTLNLDTSVKLTSNPLDAAPTRLIDDLPTVEQLTTIAIKNHPWLKKLQKEEKALRWQSRSVVSEVIPYADLNAYFSYRGPAHDKLGLNRYGGVMVKTQFGDNAGLSIPTRWLEQHRLIKQKQLEIEAAIRNVETEVINAYMDSLAADSAVEATKNAKYSSEEAYRLAKGRYQAGVGILLDVLTAQSDLNTARSNLVESVMAFNRAQVQLVKALGLANQETLITGVEPQVLNNTLTEDTADNKKSELNDQAALEEFKK